MTYRQATLYFHTGTGNSYRVAAWIADEAGETGAAITLRPIEFARPALEIGADETAFLGLVMPTHGFTREANPRHFSSWSLEIKENVQVNSLE